MTSPAPVYDLKPDLPYRSEIDPLKTANALREGVRICFLAGYDAEKIRMRDAIWALLVEAARVERSLTAPRPRAFGNGLPDPVHSPADIFAARTARLESGLPEYEHSQSRNSPTAAQISRHSEILVWLRFCHADDKLRARDVLWGLASGVPYRELVQQTGLSVQRLRSIKSEQLANIGRRLRHDLKAHGYNADNFP